MNTSKDYITLSEKHGVNPSLIKCEFCGKDYALALLGNAKKFKCTCGQVILGKRTGQCPKCKAESRTWKDCGPADGSENSLVQGHCTECENQFKLGAILFRCSTCASTGLIKHDHEICAQVREKLNIPIPGICGITLDHCPGCDNASV